MSRWRGTAWNKRVAFCRMAISPSLFAAVASVPDDGVTAYISPAVVVVLCVVAGIGTILLLPGKREVAFRRIGGATAGHGGIALSGVDCPGPGRPIWMLPGRISGYFRPSPWSGACGWSPIPGRYIRRCISVLTIFASAGLFILMYAEFMAAALVMIYAGAILITYVFVIMLASSASAPEGKPALAALGEYDAVSREPFVASLRGICPDGGVAVRDF